jgi:glycosyltransferase involved in cell wall biosynthesis
MTDTQRNEAIVGLLVAREPFIFWGPGSPGRRVGPASALAPHIGNRRAWFLIRLAWNRESEESVADDVAELRALRTRFPEHRHIMLCNTHRELELYRAQGIPGIVCSTLAFVDETQFDLAPLTAKAFDAVYIAALVPFKRHELCRNLSSVALIYHRHHPPGMQEPGYPERVRAMLPQATFVNELDGEFRMLPSQEVARWISQARVGLCLSEAEGAMRAAAEYMLCGLPVVSTPSIGGRDRILDPGFSRIVPPEPDAVAAAVQALIDLAIDPHFIRTRTFQRLRPDRIRLLQLIAAIHAEEGIACPDNAPWRELFRRGTWPTESIEDALSGPAIAELPPLASDSTWMGSGNPAGDEG